MSDKWHAINELGERLYNQRTLDDAIKLAKSMDGDTYSDPTVTVIIRADVSQQELRDALSDIADYYDND